MTEKIGRPISRKHALRIARRARLRAERERAGTPEEWSGCDVPKSCKHRFAIKTTGADGTASKRRVWCCALRAGIRVSDWRCVFPRVQRRTKCYQVKSC